MDPQSTSSDVADIMAATDPYAVLRVSRAASRSEIHKAYLRRALLVHPDKNRSEGTTAAFQKVSSAWAVLGDESQRLELDRRMRSSPGSFNFYAEADDSDEDFDVSRNISDEEAFRLFTFAAATAMVGGPSGSFQQIAELLACTEGARQLAPHCLPDPLTVFPGVEEQMPADLRADCGQVLKSASRVAMSTAIFGTGALVSLAGFPLAGRCIRRAALFQGASEVVCVLMVPSIGSRLRRSTAQALDQWSVTSEGVVHWAQSFGERASALVDGYACLPLPLPPQFRSGDTVRVSGLTRSPALNGAVGTVIKFDRTADRYQVRLWPRPVWRVPHLYKLASDDQGKTVKLVKADNLEDFKKQLSLRPSGPRDFV